MWEEVEKWTSGSLWYLDGRRRRQGRTGVTGTSGTSTYGRVSHWLLPLQVVSRVPSFVLESGFRGRPWGFSLRCLCLQKSVPFSIMQNHHFRHPDVDGAGSTHRNPFNASERHGVKDVISLSLIHLGQRIFFSKFLTVTVRPVEGDRVERTFQ